MSNTPISGLTILPGYVSTAEETALLDAVDSGLWLTDLQRRVQHYGWRYDYRSRSIDPSQALGALPGWAQAVAERLYRDGCAPDVPDQMIVNEYQPGQGISPHVDCVPCFGDTIISLTLGSTCVMTFDPLPPVRAIEQVQFFLRPGDLLVMSGEARYRWKHGIPPRKSDFVHGMTIPRGRRVSLTFRSVVLQAVA